MQKVLTLAYLVKENEICLALKKCGFGEGNWNGFGGKVEGGESVGEGVIREIKEESGVVREYDLEKVAVVEPPPKMASTPKHTHFLYARGKVNHKKLRK